MESSYSFSRNRHKRPPQIRLSKYTCPLSDPVHQHKLSRRRDDQDHPPLSVCYGCKGVHLEGKRYYYYCATCDLEFHRGCHMGPLEMKHPLHPSHPLTLISLDPDGDTSKMPHKWRESSSDSEVYQYDYIPQDDGDYHDADDVDDASPSDIYYEKCKCCRKPFQNLYYHCSICNFSLNFDCTRRPPPLSISHPKSHDHTLTLFPRRFPLPCDVCGFSLEDRHDAVYACLPCNHMVHRSCIYLPRVIKITRHQHRLSLISSCHSDRFGCGVCRETIDVNYGHYSCNKRCGYAVHSQCATLKDVWDGKDLQEVPEEPEEDIEPFVRIDEETIQYFTHEHHLILQGKNSLHGEQKFCEVCCFSISISDDFYTCMECEYVLHESCACLPRVKHHPLHKHPLILLESSPDDISYGDAYKMEGMFNCDGCHRRCFGFVYRCGEENCTFQIDVRCASLPDSSIHESHPYEDHQLYFNLIKGECMVCKSTSCSSHYLECMACCLYMGLHCVTLPTLVHYKYDSHPLTLCLGEEGTESGQYWCEICESELDASKWFYTCDSCQVTIHITCLLGIDMYMKPGNFIYIIDDAKDGAYEFEIVCNDGNTRPSCYKCAGRCTEHLVYKCEGVYFCTYDCVLRFFSFI